MAVLAASPETAAAVSFPVALLLTVMVLGGGGLLYALLFMYVRGY